MNDNPANTNWIIIVCITVAVPTITIYWRAPGIILLGLVLVLDLMVTTFPVVVYLIVCSLILTLITSTMVLNNDHYSSRIIIKITTIITTLSDIVPLNGMALRPIDEVCSPPIKNG